MTCWTQDCFHDVPPPWGEETVEVCLRAMRPSIGDHREVAAFFTRSPCPVVGINSSFCKGSIYLEGPHPLWEFWPTDDLAKGSA